ncbi:MAG: ABC transporter ATP-binding protein [Candidatus Fermentibacteraceae bacterium]
MAFERVCKSFDDGPPALSDVSLEVGDGEFLVLVGPSGCGKSTLLRILAGLTEPTSGTVRIGGRDVTGEPPGGRNIAMVFQNYALYPHMSVFDNLSFGLRMRKTPSTEISGLVRNAADVLGISELLGRKPRELSGGQKQRVALGRAIVRQPQVFLFDEPLSNLDSGLRVSMRNELAALHRRLSTTVIYVTHDQSEAMTLGDRIAVLDHGVVQQVAPPLGLYRDPANMFVAGFIGSPAINLIPGKVEKGVCHIAGGTVTSIGLPDGDCFLGVRPEHLSPDPDGDLKGRLEFIETLGNEVIQHVSIGGTTLVSRSGPDIAAVPGEMVSFSLSPLRCIFFGTDGMRIYP